MNTISRGVRNAFRNSIRTFSIILILGLSIGLALAMLVARGAVNQKISDVKSSIGNTIAVTPAGARGFEGGGEPLTTAELAKVSALPNVTNVQQSLSDRLTSDNTNLVSAIDAGSLGRRGAGNSGIRFSGGQQRELSTTDTSDGTSQPTRTFTPPVTVSGVNSTASATVYGGSTVSFTSGKALDPTKDVNEAVVGKALATKNNLTVGGTFTAYATQITVVGIYDAGNEFANAGLIMPISALQRISSQAGSVTSATVTVNSIDNMAGATTAIKTALGSAADVVSNEDTAKQAVEPLESVRTISTFSLVGAVVAGAVIILLTMVMIVRERRREIGVYKAIGASNFTIMAQFIVEALTLTLLAMIAGIIIGSVAASPVTNTLVSNSTSAAQTSQTDQAGPTSFGQGTTTRRFVRGTQGGPGIRSFGNNTVANARNIQASVGWSILAYGFGAALLIAIIGSAVPAFLISKVRPAEVMRAE